MAKVSKLDLFHQIAGGQHTGTLIAKWAFRKKNLDHYEVKFYYRTSQRSGKKWRWFDVSSTTTKSKQVTCSIPENAYAVMVKVRPIAKKHNVKVKGKKKNVAYWSSSWASKTLSVTEDSYKPTVPSVPNIELKENGVIRVEVSGNDENTTHIEFYIYREAQNGTTEGSKSYEVEIDANGLAAAEHNPQYSGYRYKVMARSINKKVENYMSAWSGYSDEVVSKPSAVPPPSAILIDKINSIIRVTVAGVVGVETYKIQYTNRKGVWSGEGVSETTIGKGYRSIDISVGAGTQYWVRAKGLTKDNVEGPYGGITEVIVGKPPQPPSTWSDRVTAKIGQPIIFYWVHNTVDGSAQQLAQIEINANGSTRIIDVKPKLDSSTGDNSNKGDYTLATNSYPDQTKLRWRVRTKGIFNEWSDWSTQREISLYVPPTLNVSLYQDLGSQLPSEILESFPFYIKAEAGPITQKAIGFYISVVSNNTYEYVAPDGTQQMIGTGQEVYSEFFDFSTDQNVQFGDYATVKDNILELRLSADNIDLEEGIEYTVNASVSMNTGLEARNGSEDIFSVGWKDEVYEPDAEFIYDEDNLTMSIVPYCEEPANFDPTLDYPDNYDYQYKLVEGVTLSVYRREPNGELKLVADNVKNDKATAVSDPHPSLGDAFYRIVAITTKTGAVAYYDPPGYPVGETDIVIQWDESWEDLDLVEVVDMESGDIEFDTGAESSWSGSILRLPYNIDTSESSSPDVALIKPIGRKRPVSHYGTQLGETATWNTEFPKSDIETINLLRRLQAWQGDVYVREPSGTGYWANVTVSFNLTHLELIVPVTINITRVEGGL